MLERRRNGEAVLRLTMFQLSAFLVSALFCVYGPEVIQAAPTNVTRSADSSTYQYANPLDVSPITSDVNDAWKVDGALELTSTKESNSKVFTTVATTQRDIVSKTDFSTTVKAFTSTTGALNKTARVKAKSDNDTNLSTTPTEDVSTVPAPVTTSVPLQGARAEFLLANEDNLATTAPTIVSSVGSSIDKTTTYVLSSTLKKATSKGPKLSTTTEIVSTNNSINSQTTAASVEGITVDKRRSNATTDPQELIPIVGSNVRSSTVASTDKSRFATTSTISVTTVEKTTFALTTGIVASTDKPGRADVSTTTLTSTGKSSNSGVSIIPKTSAESSNQTNSPAAAASNLVGQYGQPANDSITDPTFEVVDQNSFVTTSSGSVLSSTLLPPVVSSTDANLESNKYPDITDMDSSSGDETSSIVVISSNTGNQTVSQTPAFNTTRDVKTPPIVVSLDTTLPLSSSSVTTTSTIAQVPASESDGQTTVTQDNSATAAPSGDGEKTSVKGVNMKTTAPPKPLTLILIAVAASLLALLIILCVVTYVKFRKKSRSIRKRLTFKDDAIYDNPIYHGRWEVPKAPEPTSSSCPRSLPMLITALPDEVLRLSKDEDTGFHVQFMMLNKLSPGLPQQAAMSDVNITKNRYRDILPFDHNRVKLDVEEGLPDYINASYVPGVKSEREYVVSQGPLERTAPDHWRMIWELNVRVVTMLTTCEEGDLIFKSKCCQYWPNKENESVNYGGIYVTLVSTARLCRENYKLKVLHIRKGKDAEPRKVQLFQYIKWPDRKNPDDPEAFLEFRNHVRQEIATTDEQLPVLVHCSAGVGRTGTFIAIDTLLQHMEERESIDVYGLVLRLRRYRVLLVQNVNQYKFVHSCLLIILDKLKKAEVDEGRKKGLDGSYPYENMVMGQRAVVGQLGGLVHGGEESDVPLQQSSAVQNFLRKTKTNAHQPDIEFEDDQCQRSEGMPSPVRVDEWPRPLSDPVPRPVIETPKSKPFQSSSKGDPERALAKELGGMFQGGFDHHASPGKTAAIKAFLRNRDLEPDSDLPQTSDIHSGDSLVIDNRFREDSGKQTTCL